METIHLNQSNLAEWKKRARPNVMALGCFDGLHHGHSRVIKTALQKAEEEQVSLSVMSFFPHPKTVISKGKVHVHYLMPLEEKEVKLREMGVDTFYIVEFNKEFAGLSPEQFVTNYLVDFGVLHAVAGFDFSYGYRGAGHLDRLGDDSGGHIEVTKVAKVECRGEKVSSTCIRERLLTGNVEELPDFLGQLYEIKCEWDGFTLRTQPYYTLPAPGRYAVTLNNESSSIQSELLVNEDHSLLCVEDIPSFMKGRASIVWHRRILDETDDKKLLIS